MNRLSYIRSGLWLWFTTSCGLADFTSSPQITSSPKNSSADQRQNRDQDRDHNQDKAPSPSDPSREKATDKTMEIDPGPAPGDTNAPLTTSAYSLGCEPTKTFAFAPTEPRGGRFGIALTGEFCQQASNDLYVLFIIDNSTSMGKHYSSFFLKEGNDPQVTDATNTPTCGRLRGVRAILKKFQDPSLANLKTRIGVISFATNVIEAKEIKSAADPISPNLVSEKIFCATVSQTGVIPSQPGGLDIPGESYLTNYEAALLKAKDMLQNIPGQKVIYFITDGEPTAPTNLTVATMQGIAAAEKLRSEVKNVTVNAVFLKASDPVKAKEILAKITADPKRVLLASNPDEIASKLIEFQPLGFIDGSLKASLSVNPKAAEPLKAELTKHPTKANSWTYKTEIFPLSGKPGQVVDHIVTVGAKALDGTSLQSTITIQYTMPP